MVQPAWYCKAQSTGGVKHRSASQFRLPANPANQPDGKGDQQHEPPEVTQLARGQLHERRGARKKEHRPITTAHSTASCQKARARVAITDQPVRLPLLAAPRDLHSEPTRKAFGGRGRRSLCRRWPRPPGAVLRLSCWRCLTWSPGARLHTRIWTSSRSDCMEPLFADLHDRC